MKVPYKWMQRYTEIPVTAGELAERMVMHGTGVEGVEDQREAVQNVVVGRILSVRKHENSDHMVVCAVDVGEAEPLQIVTGAPNVHEGDLVPVAKVGALLPGGVAIKKSKLRGVDSYGMCCSGPELGVPEALYPSVGDKGLLVFAEPHEPGEDVRPILGIDDAVLDFEILANRPDCLSVWGVSREAAATLGTSFKKPDIEVKTVPGKIADYVTIDVRDSALCPRYCARVVKNVKIGPSPMWMREALHAAGVRPINNIVDITNYVMLETGHPMHAFDLAKVRDAHIIVRRANEGETIVTLDGKERQLTPSMLMIADQQNATGIAGVMGGEESEITEGTATVLFEIAAFDRTSIRLTTRALGLRTEASGRYERGVCAATCREAADRACQLVNLLGAGEVIEDVYDCYPNPKPVPVIEASVERICKLIGIDVPGEEMVRILTSLDMRASLSGDTLTVTPPAYREDMEQEADVAEEVLRIYGYDHIGSTLLRGETAPGVRSERIRIADKVAQILTAKGFSEIRTFSFISPRLIDKLSLAPDDARRDALRLLNPLGEDTSVMRSTLAPSMLSTLALNQSRNNDTALLYEIGPAFQNHGRKAGELPHERPALCVGAYGEAVDFYFLRDAILEMLARFGVAAEVVPGGEPYHHPGRAATLTVKGEAIGTVGELHPDVMAAFELSRRPLIAEVDLERLAALRTRMEHVRDLPRFPAVTRDLALVMDEKTTVGSVLAVLRRAGRPLLDEAEMFDIYRGAQLLPGKKSVAFSLSFRHPDRTLSDEEVKPVIDRMLSECEKQCGAKLRL